MQQHASYCACWRGRASTLTNRQDVTLVLRGDKGIGKDFFVGILKDLFGSITFSRLPDPNWSSVSSMHTWKTKQ